MNTIGPDGIYSIKKIKNKRYLSIIFKTDQEKTVRNKFQKNFKIRHKNEIEFICACNHKNAVILRKVFPFTAPKPLGLKSAFGMGCRTGWAYGNVAMAMLATKLKVPVILAQQSAREIERTGRSFVDVVDTATWAAFEAKLNIPWGADGDHLKTKEQVKKAFLAGCTYFTYDPSDYIQNEIDGKKIEELYINELERTFKASIPLKIGKKLLKFYSGMPFSIHGIKYNFTAEEVMRIAVKYYRAIDNVSELYKVTKMLKGNEPFDAEISIDETETETTTLALIFISSELVKRKIEFIGIAPRFIGNFEKAIDYYSYIDSNTGEKVMNLKDFNNKLKEIVAVAKYFNYKISVHSGSDKFSIYPLLAKYAKGRIHVKTAGTSYLEELRVITLKSAKLFKDIYTFSRKQFEKDRATYQLSTNTDNIPDITKLKSEKIFKLLASGSGNDDLRQVMHVTYGSVLKSQKFFNRCKEVLLNNEEKHFSILSKHLKKHIKTLKF